MLEWVRNDVTSTRLQERIMHQYADARGSYPTGVKPAVINGVSGDTR